uniref:Uncharacterized protein n=1 Tax=Arundo donax TaxID=35708 RepID=A0A0A9G983_ARUDO
MDGRGGPCRLASAALMCLAGDGGGKGSRSSRLAGVVGAEPAPGGAGDLLGDAAEPPKRWCAGLGLGVENAKKGDTAQCFFAGVPTADPGGGGVAGTACGGEWSASRVSGFAWHPPIFYRLAGGEAGVARRARDLLGGVGS